jgi:hypothetical protein
MPRSVLVRSALLALWAGALAQASEIIDRHALVTRHNPHLTALDPWAPLSVGNGQFCFTVDVTGLQTFSEHYHAKGIGLETQARWSWHSNPNPRAYTLTDANRPYTAYGKTIGYPSNDKTPAGQWLRENPHAMPLPQVALSLRRAGGGALAPEGIHGIDQTLDLWAGTITSRYTIDGAPVEVVVACMPDRDLLAVRLESPLVASGALGVAVAFPRGHDLGTENNPKLDWSAPESHVTNVLAQDDRAVAWEHARDDAHYFAALASAAPVTLERTGPHAFRLGGNGNMLEFTLAFGPAPLGQEGDSGSVRRAAAEYWRKFWSTGGAVDFSGSTDPRAAELERRVVLSQYLTAIQFAGDFPPSESGLTIGTWYQKHHTEMIWWHTAHFALWGRDAFLAKNLDWFTRALPVAREIAKSRDLPRRTLAKDDRPRRAARVPAAIRSFIGTSLIRSTSPSCSTGTRPRPRRSRATGNWSKRPLKAWLRCCTGMMRAKCYSLGPPLWIAQEIYDQATSVNPTYELSYWSRGLQIAQRVAGTSGPFAGGGVGPDDQFPRSAAREGRQDVALESHPDTWENVASRHDHPSFLMALGQLPGDGVDRAGDG